jgi:hypothetical protein
MSAETWYEIAKNLAALITAALGAIGVLVDFRTEDKKLTPYGYLVIGGIAVSAFLTIAATIHDDHSQQQQLESQLKTNSAELVALSRLLQPIDQLQAGVSFRLSSSAPVVKSYVVRLQKELAVILGDPTSIKAKLGSSYVSKARADSGEAEAVAILPGSALYPNSEEGAIDLVISRLNVGVNLFGARTKCCDYDSADLVAEGYAFAAHPHLEFDLVAHQLSVNGIYNLNIQRKRESMTAVPDLLGGTLVLSATVAGGDGGATRLMRTVAVHYVDLTLARGVEIWLSPRALTRLPESTDETSFGFSLPTSKDAFLSLSEPPRDR